MDDTRKLWIALAVLAVDAVLPAWFVIRNEPVPTGTKSANS